MKVTHLHLFAIAAIGGFVAYEYGAATKSGNGFLAQVQSDLSSGLTWLEGAVVGGAAGLLIGALAL